MTAFSLQNSETQKQKPSAFFLQNSETKKQKPSEEEILEEKRASKRLRKLGGVQLPTFHSCHQNSLGLTIWRISFIVDGIESVACHNWKWGLDSCLTQEEKTNQTSSSLHNLEEIISC
jgi:hypothetical protein